MPGLVAIIGRGESGARQYLLNAMVATMSHEASYTSGCRVLSDDAVGVGWTAHASSFAERVSRYRHPDGSMIVLSGECVGPVPGLDRRPLDDPEAFAAELIDATREKGPPFLVNLNGLFSAVLIDRTLRRTLIFNDRYGTERLYFRRVRESCVVASEAKAVLCAAPESRALDPESVAQWMKYGSVMNNRCLFRGVTLLPGGSVVVCDPTGVRSFDRYFDRTDWESQSPLTVDEFGVKLAGTMSEVVPDYLGGGCPIGFAITGGLDTRMIAAALPARVRNVRCYTFGIAGQETLDQRIGRKVANLCGLSHESVDLDGAWLDDYPRQLDRTVWITDGCAGATTAHEVALTEKSRACGAVRLTGNFGSEVLRDVSTLKEWVPADGFLSRDFAAAFASATPAAAVPHPVSRAAFQEIPWHLFGSMAAGRSQVTFRTPYLDNRIVQLAYRLPLGERRSSKPSTEVVKRLRPEAMTVPTDRGVTLDSAGVSHAVRRATSEVLFKLDYWDNEGLPGALWMLEPMLSLLRHTPWMGQHKYLAYRRWFRGQLRKSVDQVVAACEEISPFVDRGFAETLATRHASGRHNLLREINCVLTLATIHRLFVRQDSPFMARASAEANTT